MSRYYSDTLSNETRECRHCWMEIRSLDGAERGRFAAWVDSAGFAACPARATERAIEGVHEP